MKDVIVVSDNMRLASLIKEMAGMHTATLGQRLATSDWRPSPNDRSCSVLPKKTSDFH